jgi:hypothetical protein
MAESPKAKKRDKVIQIWHSSTLIWCIWYLHRSHPRDDGPVLAEGMRATARIPAFSNFLPPSARGAAGPLKFKMFRGVRGIWDGEARYLGVRESGRLLQKGTM